MATPMATGIEGGRRQCAARVLDADRGNKQGGDHYAEGGGLHAVVITGFLAIQNVERPADPGTQGVARTQ